MRIRDVDNVGGVQEVGGSGELFVHSDIKSFGVTGDGTTDDYDAISNALTALGSDEATLVFPAGNYYIGTSLTFPSTMTVQFERGAVIQDNGAGAVTLTINGQIDAPPVQIFNLTHASSAYAWGAGASSTDGRFYSEWWGAVADGLQGSASANSYAMQYAADASAGRGVLYFAGGEDKYVVAGRPETDGGATCCLVHSNTRVEFAPGAYIIATDAAAVLFFRNSDWVVTNPPQENIHFVGYGGIIDGNKRTHGLGSSQGGIMLRHTLNCSVTGMIVYDTPGNAINAEQVGGRIVISENFVNGDPDDNPANDWGCDGAITIQGGSNDAISEVLITGNTLHHTDESINYNAGAGTNQVGRVIVSDNIIDTNQGGNGIDIAGSQSIICSDNVIYRPATNAIYVHNSNDFPANDAQDFVITGNYIQETGYDAANTGYTNGNGIRIGRSYASQILARGVVSNNWIYNAALDGEGFVSGNSGIQVDDNVTDVVISGNLIANSLGEGINFNSGLGRNVKRISVTDNLCSYNGTSGIKVAYAENVSVVGNTCINNGSGETNPSGIFVGGVVDELTLSGNTCTDDGVEDQDYGIEFQSGGTFSNIHITGNVLTGNKEGGLRRIAQLTTSWIDGNILDDDSAWISMESGNATPSLNSPFVNVRGSASFSGTIGDGIFAGQPLTLEMNNSNNTIPVTVNKCNYGDGIIYRFSSINDYLKMEWTGNEWAVLAQDVRKTHYSAVQASASTDGVGEDDLMSATVIQDSYRGNKVLRVIAAGTKTGLNDNKVIKLHVGGTAVEAIPAANDQIDWRIEADVVLQSASAQRFTWVGYHDGITHGYDTASVDLSAGDLTIKCTGECTNAGDTITQTMLVVRSIGDKA